MKNEKIEELNLIEEDLDFWNTPTLKEELEELEEQEQEEIQDVLLNAPYFPDEMYKNLPPIFNQILTGQTSRECDMLFLSTLVGFSFILPSIWFEQANKIHNPNLICFIGAPAASNKSIIKQILKIFEKRFIEERNTLDELRRNNPKQLVCNSILYTDSSAAATLDKLEYNNGSVIIVETEIRTMMNNKKQDWGNNIPFYSESWDHGSWSTSRKGREIYIDKLNISSVQTGYLSSLLGIFSDKGSEDGFFSRCIYYVFQKKWEYKKNLLKLENKLPKINITNKIKEDVYDLENFFKLKDFELHLTESQNDNLGDYMSKLADNYIKIKDGFEHTNMRMLIVALRILMIFSAIRFFYLQNKPTLLEFNILNVYDIDIENVKLIMKILYEHTALVFDNLNKDAELKDFKKDNKITQFYNKLPQEFILKTAILIGDQTKLCSKATTQKWIKKLYECGDLIRDEHKKYTKTKK